jgi:hypothetical protein
LLQEEPLAQDLVDLVRTELHGRDTFAAPRGFLVERGNDFGQLVGCPPIGVLERRDHDAAAIEPGRRLEQVGETLERDIGERSAADRLGDSVL